MNIEPKYPQLVVEDKYSVPWMDLEKAYNRVQSNPGSRLVQVRLFDAAYWRYDLVGYIVSYPGDETKYLTYADIKRLHDELFWSRYPVQRAQIEEGKFMAEEKQVCPICGQKYTGTPALSREDNQTLICPDCRARQALAAIGVTDKDAVLAQIHDYEAQEEEQE